MRDKKLYLQAMSLRYGQVLERVPKAEWPVLSALPECKKPIETWRSRTFFVMVYLDNGFERLSVLRTELEDGSDLRFKDGVSWDDLQRLKAECGRADRWGVEVFPPDNLVVNVQNMRHMFLLNEPPAYGWKGRAP